MSQRGIYSELKPVWWFAREGKLPDAPKQIQLILSDLCNQDCSFCAYRMSGYTSNELFVGESEKAAFGTNNPKRWIPTERALKLVGEIANAGVLSIQFTGGGEPTVHPEHEDVFRYALDRNLHCSLVSNGLRWSYRLIWELLPQFDWVRVSIDAGSSASYAKIRRVPESHWDRVWKNVKLLVQALGAASSKTTLGLGFVVTPQSFSEIPAFASLAALSGVHNVRFTAMFSPEDEIPFVGIYDEVRELIEGARERYGRRDFTIYDNFGSRFDDLKQHAPDYRFCSYQFYTGYIGGDLKAYRCCVLAYNRRGLIKGGDLSTRRFDEFWASKGRQDDLEALDARGCERCQFNVKNRAMNEIRNDDMAHKEWP